MDNPRGLRLGNYELLEKLGEGGMAVVYKAHDPVLERTVAIKLIKGKTGSGKEKSRFEREAKALGQLNHPNIVKVLDYGEQDGSPFLVMEYVAGGRTLRSLLSQPMPYTEAASLLLPIARALAYAHENRIVHRDVKPSNILIDENNQLKLADFGIVKFLEVEETHDTTGTSVGIGTPEYMAPEQGTSKTIDERADIYSFGVLFYEALTGKKPFVVDTPMEALLKKLEEEPVDPKVFAPSLPEAVRRVVLKSIARKPEDRYQKMGELIQGMEELAKGNLPSNTRVLRIAPRRRPVVWVWMSILPILGFLVWIVWPLRNQWIDESNRSVSVISQTPTVTIGSSSTPQPFFTSTASPSPTITETAGPTQTPTAPATSTPTPFALREVITEQNIDQIMLINSVNIEPSYVMNLSMQFSPDTHTIMVNDLSGIRVWNASDWSLVYQLDAELLESQLNSYNLDLFNSFTYSYSGQYAAAANHKSLQVIRTTDWEHPSTLNLYTSHIEPVMLAFSKNEKLLAFTYNTSQGYSGEQSQWYGAVLELWDIENNQLLYRLHSGYSYSMKSMYFLQDDQLLFNGSYIRVEDGSIARFEGIYQTGFSDDTQNIEGTIFKYIPGCASVIANCESWKMQEQNKLVVNSPLGLYFYDLDKMRVFSSIPNVTIAPICENCAFSLDGSLIPARFEDLLRVYRVFDAREVYTFENIPNVHSLSFTPDGRYLIVINQPANNPVVSFWGLPFDQ